MGMISNVFGILDHGWTAHVLAESKLDALSLLGLVIAQSAVCRILMQAEWGHKECFLEVLSVVIYLRREEIRQ